MSMLAIQSLLPAFSPSSQVTSLSDAKMRSVVFVDAAVTLTIMQLHKNENHWR